MITADKGLAGALNTNIIRRTTRFILNEANAPTGTTNGQPDITNTNSTVVSSNTVPGTTTNTPPVVSTNSGSTTTNITLPPGTNTTGGGSTTNTSGSGSTTNSGGFGTSTNGGTSATVNVVDYTNLEMPRPGANTLHILSPTLLEVELINTKQPDPARVSQSFAQLCQFFK